MMSYFYMPNEYAGSEMLVIAAVILGMLLCLQLEIFLKKIRKKLHNSVKRGIMTSKSTQEGGKKP